MAVVASWDGATRRIYLAQGVTTFHPIEDIYREYRTWRRTVDAARQWEPFMVAVGNEDKGGGKATPRFLRLLDDDDIGQCKIVPYDEAITIDVTGELLTEDLTDPFDYSSQTTPTIVRYAPADAEIVYVELPSPIQDSLDYAGEVHYDALAGGSGTAHPWGTRAQPVNDLADAMTIASTYGLRVLRMHTDSTIDVDISGMQVKGVEQGLTLTFTTGNLIDACSFERFYMAGTVNSTTHWYADYCGFQDGFDGLWGNYQHCLIYGKVYLVGDAAFFDSASGVAGLGAAEVDAGLLGNLTVQFRRYTGGLNLYRFVSTDTVSVDLLPGVLRIKSDVTGGTFKVRGIGEPIEVDGTTTVLDSDGFNPTDASTVALITEARDEATLGRKLIDADEVLTAGAGPGNLQLIDADDGVTVLRNKTVKDKGGGAITLANGAPASKERD